MARPPGIDVHAHFFPESFIRLVEEAGAPFGAGIDRGNPQGPVIMFGASRTAPLEPRFIDLDLRLRSMNRQGVGVQALSLTVPMV
ncbi:MAG TPA: amidohydrolase, partial [Verrucomicrobiae bacterium]|nr:amidohydrolase [Verrucomicrobiae bacterium]